MLKHLLDTESAFNTTMQKPGDHSVQQRFFADTGRGKKETGVMNVTECGQNGVTVAMETGEGGLPPPS